MGGGGGVTPVITRAGVSDLGGCHLALQSRHRAEHRVLHALYLREQVLKAEDIRLTYDPQQVITLPESGFKRLDGLPERGTQFREERPHLLGAVGAHQRREPVNEFDIDRIEGERHACDHVPIVIRLRLPMS